tara:strand:+ start:437 stop:1048 length:612 start_codon:yes stop_codon:yes gene_type:complete
MKYILLFSLLLIVSCSGNKKVYVCGDRPCLDKREFKENFTTNLTIEVLPQLKKKNSYNLIQQNLKTNDINKKKSFFSKKTSKSRSKENRLKIKEAKNKLKEDKDKLKESRKISLIEEKNRTKKTKLLAKNAIIKSKEKKTAINQVNSNNTKNYSSTSKKISTTLEITEHKSICVDIQDCDIDKIKDLMIKKGSKKSFPDITLN